jgi:hypothetical protein
MGRQKVGTFWTRSRYSPYISFAKQNALTTEQIDGIITKKLGQSKLPFLVLNLGSLRHDKSLTAHAREAAKRLGEEQKRRVLFMDQPTPQLGKKLNLWWSRKFPRTPNSFIQGQTKALGQFARMNSISQNKNLSKMKAFLNGPQMRQVEKKSGYSYYQAKLEKWVTEKPGEPPSVIKSYLRRIVRSKYFYWFLLYKLIGLFVKIGIVIYFLFLRGTKEGEEKGSTLAAVETN